MYRMAIYLYAPVSQLVPRKMTLGDNIFRVTLPHGEEKENTDDFFSVEGWGPAHLAS